MEKYMMYNQKMVAAIKVGGKVLREDGETVRIPFGSEFSVLLKNLNTVRAIVNVEIDGTDVTGGAGLIVPAGGSVDLERFIKNDNMREGLRFKFIERTSKIENGPRGIKAEDGLVRVTFEFEKVVKLNMRPTLYSKSASRGIDWSYSDIGGSLGDSYGGEQTRGMQTKSLGNFSTTGAVAASAQAKSETGITVGGSVSSQQFVEGEWFPTDGVKNVLVFKLLGEVEGAPVIAPMTVRTRVECPTCGTKSDHGAKFCKECGTGLINV